VTAGSGAAFSAPESTFWAAAGAAQLDAPPTLPEVRSVKEMCVLEAKRAIKAVGFCSVAVSGQRRVSQAD